MDITAARKIIESSVKKHADYLSQAQEGVRYYQNDDDIKRTGAAAINEVNSFLKTLKKSPLKSADNRIPTNWHKILVDQKVGYLFTYPPQYDAKDDTLNQKLTEVLGEDYEKVIKQLAIDASNTGRAWLHYWYQADGQFEYWFLSPTQVVPVYDDSNVKRPLKYLVRQYEFTDDRGNSKTRFELWDDKQVAYLERLETPGSEINFETLPEGGYNIIAHSYGEIPFIEFRNNQGCTGDLAMYKRLIDAVDKLVSGFANDIDDIQEILWVIKNYAGEMSETVFDEEGKEVRREIDLKQKLKAQKYVFVDAEGGVETLQNEVPYEARGKLLDILIQQLYISAMAVNPNPEKTGNQTGVYIDFLYSLLELKAGLMETEFRSSLGRLLRAILGYLGRPIETPVSQTWTRNKPRNDTEISQILAQTPPEVMSDETKTKVHPLVEDWQAERKLIEKEQEQRMQNMLDQYPEGSEPPGGEED